jgi:hypothetical protein
MGNFHFSYANSRSCAFQQNPTNKDCLIRLIGFNREPDPGLNEKKYYASFAAARSRRYQMSSAARMSG